MFYLNLEINLLNEAFLILVLNICIVTLNKMYYRLGLYLFKFTNEIFYSALIYKRYLRVNHLHKSNVIYELN